MLFRKTRTTYDVASEKHWALNRSRVDKKSFFQELYVALGANSSATRAVQNTKAPSD